MHWILKPGSSQPEMWRITAESCRELMTIEGVRNCGSHIGQAKNADEPYGIYFTENWISVDPAVDYDETLNSVQELVDGYPGLVRDVQTYLKERIREVLTGSSDTVVIRIYGQDLHELDHKADEVRTALEGIPGIVDLKKELHMEHPQIEVEVDLAKAQQYGLKPGDVRRAAAFLIQGEEIGDLFFGAKIYGVNVWTPKEGRDSLTDVENLLIDTPNGDRVRLSLRRPEDAAQSGVGHLHVEDRIIARLLDHLGEVEIQGRVVLAKQHHEADRVAAEVDGVVVPVLDGHHGQVGAVAQRDETVATETTWSLRVLRSAPRADPGLSRVWPIIVPSGRRRCACGTTPTPPAREVDQRLGPHEAQEKGVAANPLLVVAMALNPIETSSFPDPP